MSQRDKPRLALNNNTAGVCEPSEWSDGPSDIEGKTTRVGASECGQRTSFNRIREVEHLDEIQDVVANTLKWSRREAVRHRWESRRSNEMQTTDLDSMALFVARLLCSRLEVELAFTLLIKDAIGSRTA